MDLRVGVEVAHALDVHHNQLVAGTLKREVAEGLWGEKKEKVTAETRQWAAWTPAGTALTGCGTPALPTLGAFLCRGERTEARTKQEALFNSEGPEVC